MGKAFVNASLDVTTRPASWKWIICGMLLLASAINYMDRQTLANAQVRIIAEFGLKNEQYGYVEGIFGYAFALGSVVFGWLADRKSLRWLYASVLTLWSLAGLATGFVRSYEELLICRGLLGFFEAGHWPCAVRITRLLLDPRQRSMGNSLLQGGASIGAIITPQIMFLLMTEVRSTWRIPFFAVGAVGLLWLVPWFVLLKGVPLAPERSAQAGEKAQATRSTWQVLLSPQMLVVYFVIACINTTWQILRAWLPGILQAGAGYSETFTLNYTSVWFGATEVGCIAAGAAAVWLAGRYLSVHGARLVVFAACAGLCTLASGLVPAAGGGWPLLALLALAGAGALGVFPLYHAFTQDISAEHQGRITGAAGVAGWLLPGFVQPLFGRLKDETGSFDRGLLWAGALPLAAAIAFWLFWKPSEGKSP
jgi:ACS family hexuronate transporter-like MFS transporter